MALGELAPVLAQHQGHVGEPGRFDPQGLIDEDLPGGVGDVVFTPDDLGDAHGEVIHHHREIIGGNAVGPLQHQVVQFLVVKGDGALDLVVPMGDAGLGVLKRTTVFGPGGRLQLPAVAVVLGFVAPGQGGLAAGLQILGRAVAVIGRAARPAAG